MYQKLPKVMNHIMRIREVYIECSDVDFIRLEHDLYEILPKGISKATALKKLLSYWDLI